MLNRVAHRVVGLAFLAAIGALAACGGGGGGSGGTTGGSGFVLADVQYGRLVDDGSGPRLVSPLTTATIDPVTGLMVAGSLQPLAAGVDLDAPQSLGLGTDFLPRVVPRNGVLQLVFTGALDPASLTADVADANGDVVTPGSIQVRTQDGKAIPVGITLHDSRTVWVSPLANGGVGFPPSPIDFGPSGEPRADATGYLKLRLPRSGSAIVRATDGTFLAQRRDKLGELATPIGINPGNTVLDFIAQNQLIPTNESFNGFLPDQRSPRIVRTHAHSKALDFANGDGADATTILDVAAAYSASARAGAGEWAGARLTLRPGLGNAEVKTVLANTRTTVTIFGAFALPPQDGDVYLLERGELFEPDGSHPIEPALYDADNPENSNNAQLANFVQVFEIDPLGNVVAGPTTLREAVPTFSELRIAFSEPMAAESFLPWESCRATYVPDTLDLLSEVTLDAAQKVARVRPVRIDQAAGTFEVVGWGKNSKNMQLVLTTVPKPSYLQQFMPSDDVAAFLDRGVRTITDLGGQPLAFPTSAFDPSAPAIRFTAGFTSTESSITQVPAPVVQSWGVIVHRMQGRPITGIDPATSEPGVGYRDQANYYRPIGDVNLQVNGYLAGSPVVYSTKIHDDFFPPPHGQFGKFPLGVPEPIATPNPAGGPQPHDGARFQTVWRDIDASPSRDALAGTLLDLYRVSWAPIGGNVTTDTYDNVSIHCAHSPMRPMTNQNSAGATNPYSGLGQPFDWAAWVSLTDPNIADLCKGHCSLNLGPNYWDSLVTCVQPGTRYKVVQSSLFAPPFDGNAYCPWPVFDTPFQYNNGDIPKEEVDLKTSVKNLRCSGALAWQELRNFNSNPDLDNLGGDSLLFEVRIRPQNSTISRQNGFTISIGVLLSSYPKFRVYSMGATDTNGNRFKLDPDDINGTQASRCAIHDLVNPVNDHPNGDNSRYFTVLDYVKTTSRILSPWVAVAPSSTVVPDYFAPILFPPLADQPAGTAVTFEFEGANDSKGTSGSGFSTDIDDADNKINLAFRATLVGSTSSLLLPNFDTIAIPYLRPFGG